MQRWSSSHKDAFSDRFLWYIIVNVTFRTISSVRVFPHRACVLPVYGDACFLGCGRLMLRRRRQKDSGDRGDPTSSVSSIRRWPHRRPFIHHSNSSTEFQRLSPTALHLSDKSSKSTFTRLIVTLRCGECTVSLLVLAKHANDNIITYPRFDGRTADSNS